MSTLPERIDTLERVADLHLKGYKPSEIGRALDLSPAQVKGYVRQYKEYVSSRVADDPDFMDRLQENTIQALEKFDMLIKEAWETYETAKGADMLNQQINGIKILKELEMERAKLLQLMGAKADSGMMSRMQKAEQVNGIVSGVLKEIIADCPRCKLEAGPRLATAFALMNRAEEAVDMELIPDEEDDIVDAELIDESDVEDIRVGLLADVLSDE